MPLGTETDPIAPGPRTHLCSVFPDGFATIHLTHGRTLLGEIADSVHSPALASSSRQGDIGRELRSRRSPPLRYIARRGSGNRERLRSRIIPISLGGSRQVACRRCGGLLGTAQPCGPCENDLYADPTAAAVVALATFLRPEQGHARLVATLNETSESVPLLVLLFAYLHAVAAARTPPERPQGRDTVSPHLREPPRRHGTLPLRWSSRVSSKRSTATGAGRTREAHLAKASMAELEQLLDSLKRDRQWPQ
jgi:hypothetical protein